jgi:hypothetical protein
VEVSAKIFTLPIRERGSAKLRAERSVPVGDTSEEVSALVLNYMISVLNYDAYLMVISDRCSNGLPTHESR